MPLNEPQSLYDILDLKPDATSQEVREAYLRAKATYNKDNLALYTLISTEEREETLVQIESAYQILSSPERRREYDLHHGLIDPEDDFTEQHRPTPTHRKIISIDRVPPMESGTSGEELLVPPTTEIGEMRTPFGSHDLGETPPPAARPPAAPPAAAAVAPPPSPAPRSMDPVVSLAEDLSAEIEWRGSLLKKLRESRKISIEEMAAQTKINKSYIVAVEEENYAKLPATVFVRGFVVQMARHLKLPHDRVAAAFVQRLEQARLKTK